MSADDAAKRLMDAARCAPVRDLIGADDVDTAYSVQRAVARARAGRSNRARR